MEPKERDIMFNNGKITRSLGRNGLMLTIGVNYFISNHNIVVETPINSKENGGRCHIEIPVEKSPWVALETVIDQFEKAKNLPLLMGIHPLLDEMIEPKLKEKIK